MFFLFGFWLFVFVVSLIWVVVIGIIWLFGCVWYVFGYYVEVVKCIVGFFISMLFIYIFVLGFFIVVVLDLL